MIWIIIIVLVGEVVVFVQLLMGYQSRAHRLVLAQDPMRKRIEHHRETLEELTEKTRTAADNSIDQLDKAMADYTLRCGHAANTVAELDAEAYASQGQEMEEEEEEEEESGDEDKPEEEDAIAVRTTGVYKVDLDSDRLKPIEMVQAIRHELEETFDYMEGMRRDGTIIRSTASRIGGGSGQGQKASS